MTHATDSIEYRMTWLYEAGYLKDHPRGRIVGVKITEVQSQQSGPEAYYKGFGVWVSKERVDSDLDLVNWTLGWWAKVASHSLERIEIARDAEAP